MSEPPVQTSVDEVHVHPHKTGHSRLDLVIAFSAIAISVISLFVAVAHGKTEEKLVAANSWPFLVYQSSDNGFSTDFHVVNLRLQNSGVGPARVHWLKVILDGKPARTYADLIARCCGVGDLSFKDQVQLGLVSQNDPVGVIPARDGVDLLSWRVVSGHEAVWDRVNAARRRLSFKACYCSVLDECWTSDLTPTANPHRVNECPMEPDAYTGSL